MERSFPHVHWLVFDRSIGHAYDHDPFSSLACLSIRKHFFSVDCLFCSTEMCVIRWSSRCRALLCTVRCFLPSPEIQRHFGRIRGENSGGEEQCGGRFLLLTENPGFVWLFSLSVIRGSFRRTLPFWCLMTVPVPFPRRRRLTGSVATVLLPLWRLPVPLVTSVKVRNHAAGKFSNTWTFLIHVMPSCLTSCFSGIVSPSWKIREI